MPLHRHARHETNELLLLCAAATSPPANLGFAGTWSHDGFVCINIKTLQPRTWFDEWCQRVNTPRAVHGGHGVVLRDFHTHQFPLLLLAQALQKLQKLESLIVDGATADSLMDLSTNAVYQGAATTFECGIFAACKLQGMQKKRVIANVSSQWVTSVSGIGDSPPPSAADWVFPALYSIARGTTMGRDTTT